ncbi:MAG: helix-turn-helix domain containing protein [Salinivirgaceae bacterium]|jgi:AcrR family transcriptional regulator|nr:helix-turn-helix domain containing protein [Salinivirgaceae bacterium]
MTDKKENILNAALELFAKEGFTATSTSKIAKKAGVSEGLIFRHFKNKDGLLEAILHEGEERIKILFANIIFETNAKKVIDLVFDMVLGIAASSDATDFWKLQYKIKWELEMYAESKMEPLELALTNAFKKLAFNNPEMEARSLLIIMDGLAMRYFLQKDFDINSAVNFLREKFKQ